MIPSLEGMESIPDPVRPRVAAPAEATAPAEPSPTRAERHRRAQVALALGIAWIAGTLAIFGVRADIAAPRAAGPVAAMALAIAAGLFALLRPRDRGLPAGLRLVQHTLWIAPALYVGVVIAAGTAGPPAFPPQGCIMLSNVMALGPIAAAAVALRGSFLSTAGLRGAAVGALAGLSGSLGVHAHCPEPALEHLLLAHGPAILVGAVLGLFLGRARGSV